MSIHIPDVTEQADYLELSAAHRETLDKALKQFQTENDPASNWEDAGEKEGVKLYRKTNPENAYDVPTVKGETIVENATPFQVFSVVQIPGFRKRWDGRFDFGESLERYGPQSFMFYSVMKSPSYFVWARDIVGLQENLINNDGDEIIIVQTSTSADQYVSEDASYSKSRTRATLEVSAWKLTKEGSNTKVEYVVKVHLNGSIPTSVVSMIATETPMCVGSVRDTFYTYGHAPHEILASGQQRNKTSMLHAKYEDGDGTDATSGAKKWTGYYIGEGSDSFQIKYDNKRLYASGVNVSIEGPDSSVAKASDDAEAGLITIEVTEESKGKRFEIVLTPK
ncbi:uncharacterized protein PFL1_00081 [Pseudozyma flocculosa PF-1]|uniref:START domain-containing protein n=1 Tax=Pseudozyma flocculosa TaxID=84751 RepID=A0A5C3ETQ0_9BASI|nr:uncharacterized protein PFL1_00081 [Pseudozyma flocculosa PF-1]EPQ31882.1 hypothetical protein PFL1_00081 [Pseudozyma flocculosa PF-1]SPO35210.1 uncharacterized protein PSFLO_00681 [Pseudozyma flocculosa]